MGRLASLVSCRCPHHATRLLERLHAEKLEQARRGPVDERTAQACTIRGDQPPESDIVGLPIAGFTPISDAPVIRLPAAWPPLAGCATPAAAESRCWARGCEVKELASCCHASFLRRIST